MMAATLRDMDGSSLTCRGKAEPSEGNLLLGEGLAVMTSCFYHRAKADGLDGSSFSEQILQHLGEDKGCSINI